MAHKPKLFPEFILCSYLVFVILSVYPFFRKYLYRHSRPLSSPSSSSLRSASWQTLIKSMLSDSDTALTSYPTLTSSVSPQQTISHAVTDIVPAHSNESYLHTLIPTWLYIFAECNRARRESTVNYTLVFCTFDDKNIPFLWDIKKQCFLRRRKYNYRS